ncbi:MAG: hypothetical protein HY298_24310 [Verrucomicrobia bacterium]|nr:hypothetical protein [Verrucomicrobiota bacterium]
MSSTPRSELRPDEMRAALTRLLNRNVSGVERIGGGRNSQVYEVALEGAQHFALKVYFRHHSDQRDRLATEYNSFVYLWASGFRDIPQPIAADHELGWAVYQFIEGDKLLPGQAGDAELTAALGLLCRLRELSRKPESRKLGAASEAFFAAGQVVDNVRQRLQRLRAAEGNTPAYHALRDFLETDLTPLFEQVTHWSESRLKAAGGAFAEELSWEQRTLSPSDFGFHNALRQRDGRMIFLDFEYFGWDDPAKMIADFLLHPAMDLSPALKKKFASGMFRCFSDWPDLLQRVESLYPLFGLKWCMIFLNEFLPDQFQRRQFAAVAAPDRASLQMQQLDKARQILNRIRHEYERFPYRD